MTYAQYTRTRLQKWKDILTSVGGTPLASDTLYVTVRKVAEILGADIPCCSTPGFQQMAEDILAINPYVYSTDGQMNGNLLPQGGGQPWGIDPSSTTPVDTGIILGDPDVGIMLGDPDTGIVFGHT